MNNQQNDTDTQKNITFSKLSYEALPEMWTFQILASILLAIPVTILSKLINWSAGLGGVVTTANIKSFILSWKFPVILFLGIILVLIYLVIELFAQIFLTNNILTGQRAGVKKCVLDGFKSLKHFKNFAGVRTILFIFIAVPLCGVGFSISLSQSFYIPNFIMEVVLKSPVLATAYVALILLLFWIAYRSVFILHAVLLDNMTPAEGKKYSSQLVKEHRGEFIKGIILNLLAILAIIFISNVILSQIPGLLLGNVSETMPKNYVIDINAVLNMDAELSDNDLQVLLYRSVAAFAVLMEKYLFSVVTLLSGAYFMLRLNRYYLDYSGRGKELWPERTKKARYIWKVVLIISVFVMFGVVSVGLSCYYNELFTRDEPVKIVAHRAGGTMASENSLEGIEKAVEHGCYASEIDIQRTKDGHYIINHDNDFARLTGVEKTPGEMTMDEIEELRIKDTTGNGEELPVVTFEEMLEACKGRIKLFVELKGTPPDNQMVDDAVRIIKEYDCVEDTALISLNYDVIDYAETTYPEMETGTLFFASLGDVSRLNCDLIIMEEESATSTNISNIHDGGKQAIVWTVNTEPGMYTFLDSTADAVITDEIPLAEETQEILDDRTDLEVLEDKLTIY